MKIQSFSMPTPDEIHSLIEFCKMMASSPFYQKLGPGGVMAVYLTAKEYDLPFMACMNGGLHTFDGKVSFSAIMIDALILKAGHKTKVLHLDDKSCTIRFIRGDRRNDPDYTPFEFTYDIKKAEKAGYLKKNNWQTSPTDMLYSRCLTGGGRKHIPEVFVGVLVVGELVGDDSDSNIPPLLPANIDNSQKLLENSHKIPENSAKIPQISQEKAENWEEFCTKHEIKEGSLTEKYLKEISENGSQPRTFVQTVNSAMAHEDKFITAFAKWKKKNTPQEPTTTNEAIKEMTL